MQVLQTPLAKRSEAVAELIQEMDPNNQILQVLSTSRFLNNELVPWVHPEPVLRHVSKKGKHGHLRCSVCEKDYGWSSRERCVLHILSKTHHANCKKKLAAKDTAASQNLLEEASAKAVSGDKICNLIKDYASQYCVAKSLPFTAAAMALDCVCAAFSTVVKGSISEAAITALDKKGHKHEVCNTNYANCTMYPAQTMRKLQYVSGTNHAQPAICFHFR